MKVNERLKKLLSILLCLCMLLQNCPVMVFAAAEDNLCEHHTEHTAECGYVEAAAGSDCTHIHDELCSYAETVAEVLCACTADENGALVHTEGCGYVAPIAGADCAHTHGDCGYAAPVEAKPCTYHCDICLGHDHGEEEEEEQETTAPSSEATEPTPVCDCGTDDEAIHATTCAVYVAPETAVCYCTEKCTEPNIWCDVCGFDVAACGGSDSAVSYTEEMTFMLEFGHKYVLIKHDGIWVELRPDDIPSMQTDVLEVNDLKKAILSNDSLRTSMGISDLNSSDFDKLRLKYNNTELIGSYQIIVSENYGYEISYQRVYAFPGQRIVDSNGNRIIGDVDGDGVGDSYAAAGEQITMTITAAVGYRLESLNFMTEDGKSVEVTITKGENNSYTGTLTMPAADMVEYNRFEDLATFVVCTHTGEFTYTPNGDGATHTKTCKDCGLTVDEAEEHTGSTATCKEQAKCALCGESYGELNPNNHASEERVYRIDESEPNKYHNQHHTCCGALIENTKIEHNQNADGERFDPVYTLEHGNDPSQCVIEQKCGLCQKIVGNCTLKAENQVYSGYNHIFSEEPKGAFSLNGGEFMTCCCTGGCINAGNHKYTVSISGQTVEIPFTITKAPLTVTANDITVEQYGEFPEISYTAEGFLTYDKYEDPDWTQITDDFITKPTAKVLDTAGNEVTGTSEPGTYRIVYAGGVNDNYEITYIEGTLTVTEHTEHRGGEATCKELAKCGKCGTEYGELLDHEMDPATGECKYGCGTQAMAKVNDTYYAVFANAMGDWINGGGTLTLLDNVSYDGAVVLSSGAARTFDGGEYMLTLAKPLANQGDLTMAGGTISCAEDAVNNFGKLTVTGGKIVSENFTGVINYAEMLVSGGEITGSTALNNQSIGVVTFEGGKLTTNQSITVLNNGQLNVSGGSITSTQSNAIDNAGILTITGGIIQGNGTDVIQEGNTVTITKIEDPNGLQMWTASNTVFEGTGQNVFLPEGYCALDDMGQYVVQASNRTVSIVPHTHNYTYTDNGDDTHKKACSECGYVENESEVHTGGTATCTAKAVCEQCGEYGEKNPNNHTGTLGTYVPNEDGGHIATYDCCGGTVAENHDLSYWAEGNDITWGCCDCEFALIFTLVIPTGVVYGDAPLEVPHYVSNDPSYMGMLPEITVGGQNFKFFTPKAGEHEVVMTWGGQTVTGKYIISKADPTCTVPSGLTATYGDTLAQVALNTVPGGTEGSWAWNHPISTPVGSVGTNTFKATFTPSDTDNYNTVEADITIAVAKATPTVTVPAAVSGLVYSGDAQTLVKAGSTTGGTMLYKVDDGDWSAQLPKATDAGDYTVSYKVAGDENCNDVAEQSFTVTIAKAAAPAITFPTVLNSITFGQQLRDAKLSFYENEYGTFSWNAPEGEPGSVGQHDLALDFYPSEAALNNYEWKDTADARWIESRNALCDMGRVQVIPADIADHLRIIWTGNAYNGQTQQVQLIGMDNLEATTLVAGKDYTLTYENVDPADVLENGLPVFAGDYKVTVTGMGNFTGTLTKIYRGNDESGAPYYKDVMTVDKAYLEVDENNSYADDKIYDGNADAAVTLRYSGVITGDDVILRAEGRFSDANAGENKTVTLRYRLEGTDSDNYDFGGPETMTANITPAKLTVTAIACTKVFSQADPTLTYQVSGLIGTDSQADVITGVLKRTAGENVGSYDITQGTLTADSNYTITYTGAKLTINPKTITAADVKLNGSLTYTGEQQTQEVTVTKDITYEVSGNKATNVDTYELTVKGIGNYTGEVKLSWSIQEAAAVVSTAPVANTLTYNGNAQELVTAGTTADGMLVYSLTENDEYTETIPTGNAAGDYTVWYYVQGDENHADSEKAFVKVTIAKAKATITVNTTTINVTYGETVTLPTATTNFGTVTCDKTAADLVNAGTYMVTYTVAGTANYDGDTKTLTVNVGQKAVAEPTVTGTYTYTGEEQTVVLNGFNSDYMTIASGNKGTNAGSYEVEITLDNNHKWADGSDGKVQWSIAKAKAEISVNTDPISCTYGETVTLPTATTNFGTVTCDKTAADLVNAGTYTVTYSVAGTANFEGDTKTLTVIVEQKAVAEPTVAGTYTYTGEEQTVALTGVESYMTVVSGNKGTNADSYEVVITLDGNHKWADGSDGKVQWSIAKAKAEISVNTDPITITYGETVTLPTATTNFGTVTCDKNADELVNAGAYTVAYTVAGTANFEGDTKTLTVIVEQKAVAEPTVTGTYTYTGEEQTVALTGVESYMTVVSGNKGTNADSYEVVITLDGNHKWADGSDGKVQWNIAKAKAEISVNTDPITITYGETVTLPTATTNFGTVTCDKNADELVNAGAYTVTYTVAGTGNYEGDTKSITVTINAKAITEADVKLNGSLTYNGKEQTQPITVTAGITYEVTGNKATNAGEYELTVKGTGNYTGSVNVKWSIAKASVTITANNKVIYIGEELPSLTYTVSGLMTGDELTKVPTLNTNANAAIAGTYAITVANATAGDNYEISYVSGTLTVMNAETEVETKIVQTELTEVPDGLKNTEFNTVEAITEELISRILATSNGFTEENMEHYDVTLQFSLDGGKTWIHATEENFPTEGITVILPYPEGTNARDYEFVVSHMFTVTSQRLGTTAGDVELPKVEETANGIRVTLNGLSPVTVAAKYHDHTGGTATCTDKAICSICGNAYGELDATNHAGGTEVKDVKEATCGADGYTGDTYCKGCGEVVEKGTTIKATGEHTYGDWKVVKEPTKTTKGEKQRTCSVCGHVDTKEIPVLSDTPATGDDSNIMLYGSMFTMSLAAIVVLLLASKKRKQAN